MHYTEKKAGTSLPSDRPKVDDILSAIAHLQVAYTKLDSQRTHHIKHLPGKERDRMYDRLGEVMGDIWEQYENCCDILFQIQRPSIDD